MNIDILDYIILDLIVRKSFFVMIYKNNRKKKKLLKEEKNFLNKKIIKPIMNF
jgi:hypothetical protein